MSAAAPSGVTATEFGFAIDESSVIGALTVPGAPTVGVELTGIVTAALVPSPGRTTYAVQASPAAADGPISRTVATTVATHASAMPATTQPARRSGRRS